MTIRSGTDPLGPLEQGWRIACWLAAAAIFFEGAWVRFTLPQWPVIVPDSYIYLIPTVNGGAYGIGPRMFLYPMFCRTAVHLARDWRGIVVSQHLLGLLGAALLLQAWWSVGRKIWLTPAGRAAHDAAGIAMVLLLVPSGVYVAYEQQVLLESVNAFLQCCLLALLCRLWLPSPRASVACGVASLAVFMYYANPRWGAAAPVVVMLAAGVVLTAGRLRAFWLVLAAVAATFAGFARLQSRLVASDPWDDNFTATHLLWMHADLAVNEFRRDLEAPTPPAHAQLLRKIIPKIEKEIVGYDASYWHTLTFNANALLYNPDNPAADVVTAFHGDPAGYKRFCLHYYLCIIRHQPGAYFDKVSRMLRYYYATPPLRDGAFREVTSPVTALLLGSSPIARQLADSAVPAERAELKAAAVAMAVPTFPPEAYAAPNWLSAVVEQARIWFLPVTVAGAVSGLIALWRTRQTAARGLAVLAKICLSAIAILFAQVLTLAMVTITEGRYSDALRTLAVFSLVCSLLMGASLAVELTIVCGRRLKKSPRFAATSHQASISDLSELGNQTQA